MISIKLFCILASAFVMVPISSFLFMYLMASLFSSKLRSYFDNFSIIFESNIIGFEIDFPIKNEIIIALIY